MNIIVVGLGSMGKRRIRLLKRIKPECTIIGVDSNTERASAVKEEYGIVIDHSLENVISRTDNGCFYFASFTWEYY